MRLTNHHNSHEHTLVFATTFETKHDSAHAAVAAIAMPAPRPQLLLAELEAELGLGLVFCGSCRGLSGQGGRYPGGQGRWQPAGS